MALGSLLLGQNRTVTIIWITFYIIKILVIAIQPLIHLLFLSLGCLDFPATELKASKKVNFLFILLSFSCITLVRLVHPVIMFILRGGFNFEDATYLLIVKQDVLVISDY
jgi:hypothetical protein